ncbi:glycoside hydrolase family 3 C-terminal domain-containing protein, partial [Paenibacillus sp. MCAF20]
SSILYAKGFTLEGDLEDDVLTEEAKRAASEAEVVIIFAGLPDRYESEGYDRSHMRLPDNQNRIIEAVASVQSRIVIVLMNGSPVEMPWENDVTSILEAYLGGQAVGGAIADILYGIANPSGKLAETFPMKVSDNPSYLFFPGSGDRVEYREGLYVGYRYYDAKQTKPLFPFGHGLSYTTFDYSNLTIDRKEINDTETVNVQVTVTNTGLRAGKEIVQLYVRDVASTIDRPDKELKGFAKLELQPGEQKTVTIELDKRSFAYFNVELKDWHVESGQFAVLIGRSSEDIVLSDTLNVTSTVELQATYHRNSLLGDLLNNPRTAPMIGPMLQQMQSMMPLGDDAEEHGSEMMKAMMNYLPLRNLVSFSQGAFTD